jgi:hypothetical protein
MCAPSLDFLVIGHKRVAGQKWSFGGEVQLPPRASSKNTIPKFFPGWTFMPSAWQRRPLAGISRL